MKRLCFCLLLVMALLVTQTSAAVILLNKVGTSQSHWSGLSTDTKPTPSATGYGSTFYEENTGITYVYGSSGWVVQKVSVTGSILSTTTKWGSAGVGNEQITVNGLKTLTAAKINPTGATETLAILSVDDAPIRFRVGANASATVGIELNIGDIMALSELSASSLLALTMFPVSGAPVVNVQYLYR